MEDKISIKRTLLDLLAIPEQVSIAFDDNPRYQKLLSFLLSKDFYNDDNLSIPTLKEIEAETGLKSYHVRKQIEEMYEYLYDYESGFEFQFGKLEIFFWLNSNKKSACFKCKKMECLPRVGENITIPFLKAKMGRDYFYVEDIRHSFEGKKHIIDVHLSPGIFNLYWNYRKHKALELGEISYMDLINLYEFQIKDKLGID
ncbi:hypothetical protein [Galbibacter sp. PAP.153]|uniref:hypothetical protein n=1 Tax=Galbibacter sp. PAP.153 TaxID=3104623 RepID=UPI0030084479